MIFFGFAGFFYLGAGNFFPLPAIFLTLPAKKKAGGLQLL
jgi:hypothetical protein